jgi:hypothetical protein
MNRASVIGSWGLTAAIVLQMTVPASAEDCATIVNALKATAAAPALRQFLSIPSRPGGERLFSVQLGDVVYVSLGIGGASHWQKMSRSKMRAEAEEAMQDVTYHDCKLLGPETVNGYQTSIYEYTMQDGSGGPAQIRPGGRSKIWIGTDGLVLRQDAAGGSSVRYEYNAVEAPN